METSPRWPWITIVVLQIGQLVSLFPWLMVAALSFMAFDAPGSDKIWQPWAFVLGIWSYPIWLLLAGIVSWVLFYHGRHLAAVVLASIFTLPLPVLVLIFTISALG